MAIHLWSFIATVCVQCLYKPIAVHATMYAWNNSKEVRKKLTTLLGYTIHCVLGIITGVQAPGNNIRWSTSTMPMEQVRMPREVTIASDKQQSIYPNLVPCFHIKSTGFHEVLYCGQLALLGCPVQGCVSIVIRVKEVALHLGEKVLCNSKMATSSTQEKGVVSSLHWTIGTGSQQLTICAYMHAGT